MNNYPFISIVVASYNRENIITVSLKSLLELDYPKNSYEIVFLIIILLIILIVLLNY